MKALLALLATLLLTTAAARMGCWNRCCGGRAACRDAQQPDAYYLGSHGPEGPAYELASRFAEHLGGVVAHVTVRTREAAVGRWRRPRAPRCPAGLTIRHRAARNARFGAGYQQVREHLACTGVARRGRHRSPLARRGRSRSPEGSAHQRTLEDLRLRAPRLGRGSSALQRTRRRSSRASRVRGRLHARQFDGVRARQDRQSRDRHRPRPLARARRRLGGQHPPRTTTRCSGASTPSSSGRGRTARSPGCSSATTGAQRASTTCSRGTSCSTWKAACRAISIGFREASEYHDLDWRLLAAMGYQESKWDPGAVSFTACALMQLTEDTARDDAGRRPARPALEHFREAARYLARLMTMIPPRIPEPDRTWLAVAAYNVGFGHVEDARILARSTAQPDLGGRARVPAAAGPGTLVHGARAGAMRAGGSRCVMSTTCRPTSTSSPWQDSANPPRREGSATVAVPPLREPRPRTGGSLSAVACSASGEEEAPEQRGALLRQYSARAFDAGD